VATVGMAARVLYMLTVFPRKLTCVVKGKCIKECSARNALTTADFMETNGFCCRSCFIPIDQLVHILFVVDATHSDPKFFHLLTPGASDVSPYYQKQWSLRKQ